MEGKESESRFYALLKPIRDLADNWNIDVAAELEDYLEDLGSIVISINESKTKLDFAQAALMIQGSAVVYSKKVEFLYNLVFETLNLLSKQKKPKGEGSKEKALAHMVIDDPVVVLDSSIFGERGNIDLKADEREAQRRAVMNNNSKRYSVLSLYESNMGVISSNLTTDSKDKSFFLSRCSISPSGQFTIGRVNSTTSALTMSRPTRNNSEISAIASETTPDNSHSFASHDEVSVILGDGEQSVLSDKRDSATGSSNGNDGVTNQPEESSNTNVSISNDGGDSDFDPGDMDVPDNYPSPREEQTPASPPAKTDIWHMEDPYDATGNRPIPYSRGKVLLDKEEVRRRNEQGSRRNGAETSDLFCRPADMLFVIPSSELNVFNHQSSAIKEALRKQISVQRISSTSQRKTQTTTTVAQIEALLDNDEPDVGDMLDIGYDGDSDGELAPNLEDEAAQQRELEETRLDVSMSLAGEGTYVTSMSALLNQTSVMEGSTLEGSTLLGLHGNMSGIGSSSSGGSSHTMGLSFGGVNGNEQSMIATDTGEYITYEDLCRQHMEKFMSGVEKFTRETKLVRRVNEWETRIVPMLEDQDRHEQFDIRKERTMLLGELRALEQVKAEEKRKQQMGEENEEKDDRNGEDQEGMQIEAEGRENAYAKDGDDDDDEYRENGEQEVVVQPEVALRELAATRQPFEVSRMFVSLLQMANDGNVKLSSSGACNDVDIRLLSEDIPTVSR